MSAASSWAEPPSPGAVSPGLSRPLPEEARVPSGWPPLRAEHERSGANTRETERHLPPRPGVLCGGCCAGEDRTLKAVVTVGALLGGAHLVIHEELSWASHLLGAGMNK